MKGLATSTIDWLKHGNYSDAPLSDWLAFLAIVLVLSFLWDRVIKAQIS